MITLVEALGYRSLRYISQPLGPFHVLVGPNASGKTTFLDVIAFLGRLVSDGLEAAVGERTQNFYDLLWQRKGQHFELAVETRVLEVRSDQDTFRYEVMIEIDSDSQEMGIVTERLFLQAGGSRDFSERKLFPEPSEVPARLGGGMADRVLVFHRIEGRAYGSWEGRHFLLELAPRRSVLASLFISDESFSSFKDLLTTGVQQLVLNSLLLR